ncbi:MAG TPA: hypothetical protein VFZ79_17965, partial [Acidimicrobiales bacterium]
MANETITGDRGAKERATDAAGAATEQAKGVAGEARQEASAVVSEAGAQARNLVDEARTALHDQAADRTDKAAGAIGDLGSRLRALADGNPDAAGDLRRYAADLGDRLDGVASRLSSRGFDGMVEDVQGFARRRPGMFLAAAAATGFAAGRLFRGAKAEADGSQDAGAQQRQLSTGQTGALPDTGAAGVPVGSDPSRVTTGGPGAEAVRPG